MILEFLRNQKQTIMLAKKRLQKRDIKSYKKSIIILNFLKNEEKKSRLTIEDKMKNQKLASHRILNENVIGMIKRFRIVSERYRNRRKRFGL